MTLYALFLERHLPLEIKNLTCFVESNDDYKRGYFQLQLNSLAHLHSVMKNDMKTFFGKFYFEILVFKEIFF